MSKIHFIGGEKGWGGKSVVVDSYESLDLIVESAINKIDAGSTSFWAAKNRSETDVKGLGILELQRVKMWLNSAYAEIDRPGI